MRNTLLFLTLFTALALIGCGGGSKLATVKVSGTVTLDGAPLADALVTFTPKTAGVGNPGYGKTDASGRYQLSTSSGAVDAGTTPGDYLVSVIKAEVNESGSAKSLIPVRYSNAGKSGLTATVENKRSNEINFELKSD